MVSHRSTPAESHKAVKTALLGLAETDQPDGAITTFLHLIRSSAICCVACPFPVPFPATKRVALCARLYAGYHVIPSRYRGRGSLFYADQPRRRPDHLLLDTSLHPLYDESRHCFSSFFSSSSSSSHLPSPDWSILSPHLTSSPFQRPTLAVV